MTAALASTALTPSVAPHIQKFRLLGLAQRPLVIWYQPVSVASSPVPRVSTPATPNGLSLHTQSCFMPL